MIRLGDTIRMTKSERDTLSELVGISVNPQTVAQFNAFVNQARNEHLSQADDAQAHSDSEDDQSGGPEARLMSAVLLNKIAAHSPTTATERAFSRGSSGEVLTFGALKACVFS